MIFVKPPPRGEDAQGSGAYGASRRGKGGKTYTHKGLDYACRPGTRVYSAVRGLVTRLGYPYRGNRELRLIEIEDAHNSLIRYMYVFPKVTKLMLINRGDLLGTVQKLPYRGITQHVHVEVRQMVNQRRKLVDPEKYFEEHWG